MFWAAYVLLKLIDLYLVLIFVYVIGRWMMPHFSYHGWYRAIDSVTAPFVNLFRSLNLHYGRLDFSPVAATLTLSVLRMGVVTAMHGGIWR